MQSKLTGVAIVTIVDRLAGELDRILQMPDVQARLRGLGGEPGGMTLEQFAEMNRADYERMGKLVRDANIKAEE